MLQFDSYIIENVTPQRSPRKAPCENVTNLKRRNPLKHSRLQTDVVRNPPFVTFPINETIGKKSSFCNIFDEKKVLHPLVLLQKCAIFANRQLAYGLGEIRKPRNSFAPLL